MSHVYQWGEEGYFLQGAREAQHGGGWALPARSRPRSFDDASQHPRRAQRLPPHAFGLAGERAFDVLITTNGTLMDKHLEPLARVRICPFSSQTGTKRRTATSAAREISSDRPKGLSALFELEGRSSLPTKW
jgi:hypothetical protein